MHDRAQLAPAMMWAQEISRIFSVEAGEAKFAARHNSIRTYALQQEALNRVCPAGESTASTRKDGYGGDTTKFLQHSVERTCHR